MSTVIPCTGNRCTIKYALAIYLFGFGTLYWYAKILLESKCVFYGASISKQLGF